MMDDVLKACASYHSTTTSPTSVKLSSQAVGLLSVLAISGSVALLTLGKQKLWQYVFESPSNASPFFPSSESGILSSLADENVRAQFLCIDGGALESRSVNDSNQMVRCSTTFTTTTVTQKRERSTSKKVRFAPDVVDPAGDGREYRRRIKEAYRNQIREQFKQKSSSAQTFAKEGRVQQRSSLPPNRIVLYSGLIKQNRLQQALQWS